MGNQEQISGFKLPRSIGRYEVTRLLDRGASYANFEAHHQTLGHRLQLRQELWPADRLGEDRRLALEALRQARLLQAELRHPRILPLVDFFEDNGEWFSVFPHVPGAISLYETIRSIEEGKRPPCGIEEFTELSAGITDALAAIHGAGYVHRTLGTNNILIDEKFGPFLSDLGCATPIGADDAMARAFRSAMRPASAAPEQFSGEEPFSPATDTWALGVALFELRYGRHPFLSGTSAAMPAIVGSILFEEASFPAATGTEQEHDSDQADLLTQWLTRLLEKDPQKRYQNALEAQRDLEGIAAELQARPKVAAAFVAMPFEDQFDPVWRAIWSACASSRIAASRADASHRHDDIWDEICDAITSADFVIAVASKNEDQGFNPNVMLEIGYARAKNKPLLLLAENPESLPFDLRTQRALVYQVESIGGGAFHRELLDSLQALCRAAGD